MCIRDRAVAQPLNIIIPARALNELARVAHDPEEPIYMVVPCLLYTSDAADERSSVDLGGRRIIKKKNNIETRGTRQHYKDKQSQSREETDTWTTIWKH